VRLEWIRERHAVRHTVISSPRSIRPLPPDLVERIAAGEVIERPASVVRELVENSLDAGATRVEIDIEEGGVRRVRVRDDGAGIARDDLAWAIHPHATSKISSYDDLGALFTLGFRGEALASMSAVAEVKIVSRARDSEEAYALEAGGVGELGAPRRASHPPGTTVEVRDLFFRLPARRRFLRSVPTETRHVLEAVRRLAFAHPEVSFEVRDERRVLLATTAITEENSEATRGWLESLAGRRFADGALYLSAVVDAYRLDGWLLDPRAAGEETEPQLWSVNGRPLRDRVLHHAVRRGCEEFLHARAQATYLLRLSVPAGEVDMNVHPAKQEIRFRDGGRLHSFVEHACHERLAAPRSGQARLVTPPAPTLRKHAEGEEFPHRDARPPAVSDSAPLFDARDARRPSPRIALRMDEALSRAATETDQDFVRTTERRLGEPLAILAGAFLVARADDNLVVVDVHAAHERLLFEELKAQFRSGPVPRQVLLVPYPANLAPRTAELLAEAAPRLERLGFEIERMGPETVVVRAVPTLLGHSDPRTLLEAVASRWDDEPDEGLLAERLFAVLADVACDAAVKAGETMGQEAMTDLLRRLERTEGAEHCSHGRPSYVVLGRETFEHFFRRGR
jgi:DNA mismatch repair protein MutL